MNQILNHRARGIIGVRADARSATEILTELQQTFAAFKEERDAELKGIKAKFADVVQTEKVDRINNEITALTNSLNEVNQVLAAMKAGGGAGAQPDPIKAEHAKAFDRYFRKGVESNLAELQVKAALTTQSDPDGGYLVPTEMSQTIDRILGTTSVMRQLATVMPIGTNEYKKLVNMGGAASGWVGEEQARPETNTPKLRELIFSVMEIYANPATTRTMLDDGIVDIGAWLGSEVDTTFAEQEGAAFVSGDGVKRPRGILAYPIVANSSYSWGNVGYVPSGAAADFIATTTSANPADCLIDLLYALKQGYRNNASFLMSDLTMARVRKFKDADGNYIWAAPTATEQVATILQKPVYNDDNMQAIGANSYPIACGDFQRGYLIIDRQGIRVLRDEFTNKPYVHFYTTKRVGGGIQNFEAIKLLKMATS